MHNFVANLNNEIICYSLVMSSAEYQKKEGQKKKKFLKVQNGFNQEEVKSDDYLVFLNTFCYILIFI